MTHVIQGVVITISDQGIALAPKPARVARLGFDVRHVLASGRMSPTLAGRLAGKSGFLCTTCFGRVGRAAVKPLFARQHAVAYLAVLTAPLRSGLQALMSIFACSPPRFIPFKGFGPASLLYADAFFELGGEVRRPGDAAQLPPEWAKSWPPALVIGWGFVLIPAGGGTPMFAHGPVPPALLRALHTNGRLSLFRRLWHNFCRCSCSTHCSWGPPGRSLITSLQSTLSLRAIAETLPPIS